MVELGTAFGGIATSQREIDAFAPAQFVRSVAARSVGTTLPSAAATSLARKTSAWAAPAISRSADPAAQLDPGGEQRAVFAGVGVRRAAGEADAFPFRNRTVLREPGGETPPDSPEPKISPAIVAARPPTGPR